MLSVRIRIPKICKKKLTCKILKDWSKSRES